MTGEGGAEQVGAGVACRLTLPDGRVIEFDLAGPLVALAPAAEKTKKRPACRQGGK